MAFEQRDNSASAFKNDKKEKAEHADYRGTAKIDGVEYWLNTWIKKDKNGNTYFSHAFKRKDVPTQENRPVESKPWKNDFDDDIPF